VAGRSRSCEKLHKMWFFLGLAAVAVMAVPTMISMLVVVIYNMADTFFIGQTGDPMQVAAVSLATPVFMVFMALVNLF